MLLVAKMVGQLGMHRTLYKSTRQLLQQALFADQVLRSLVIRKQLVDDSFVDSHTSLLVLRNLHLHKILNTLPSVRTSEPGSTAPETKGTKLAPDTSLTCCKRTRPRRLGDNTSMAIATINLQSAPRPRTPCATPPTSVSSTSTGPHRRSRPGRTMAVRSFCKIVHAV